MTARNVSLTDRLDAFVEQQVTTTGRHQSASDVVREALRRYEADLIAEAACLDMIRGVAQDGRDTVARGEFAVIDSDEARHTLFQCITGKAAIELGDVGSLAPRRSGVDHAKSASIGSASMRRTHRRIRNHRTKQLLK